MRIANFPSFSQGEGLGGGRGSSLEEILLRLTLNGSSSLSQKVLFWGEGVGEVASYVAGWMAGRGIGVIVLDGANRFDPYTASAFARRVLVPPEKLLKKIQIARAFTCYQMATLMGERLLELVERESSSSSVYRKPWVILLGPVAPFLDEDVPEREVRPLFERALSKVEKMAMAGVSFFLFQPPLSSGCRRSYLMRRLVKFSNWIWRISLEDQRPKMILEKGLRFNRLGNERWDVRFCRLVRS